MIPSINYEVIAMEEKEIKDLCGKVLAAWIISNSKKDFTKHDEDIIKEFIPSILLKKFKVFNIDIVLPDELFPNNSIIFPFPKPPPSIELTS